MRRPYPVSLQQKLPVSEQHTGILSFGAGGIFSWASGADALLLYSGGPKP